jgi:hypothetical protein
VGTSCEEKMQPLAYQDVVAILATWYIQRKSLPQHYKIGFKVCAIKLYRY